MRRTWGSWIALLAGGLGLRVLLRRRVQGSPPVSPADELKAKLAAAKEKDGERIPEEEPSPEEEPPAGVDERRADVHARARRAIDELRED